MYYPDIKSKIEMLPENAKQEISDFVEFLLYKYYKPLTKSPVNWKNKGICEEEKVSRHKKFHKFVGYLSHQKASPDMIIENLRGKLDDLSD